MAKFERYRETFSCPKCERQGRAEIEEEENPVFYGGLHPRVVDVSPGFIATSDAIVCDKCNEVALKL